MMKLIVILIIVFSAWVAHVSGGALIAAEKEFATRVTACRSICEPADLKEVQGKFCICDTTKLVKEIK